MSPLEGRTNETVCLPSCDIRSYSRCHRRGTGAARLTDIPTDTRSTDGLADGIRIIRDSGVLESCAEEARDMAQREWLALSNRLADSDAKTMLQMLTFRILEEALEP